MFLFTPFTLYKAGIKNTERSDFHFRAPANTDLVQNYSADTKTLIGHICKSVLFWQISFFADKFEHICMLEVMEISPEVMMIQHFDPEQNHPLDLW